MTAETYFEGTRWLMLRAREQKFSHFDHDDADGVAVYKVVNPEYMEWLEADNATLREKYINAVKDNAEVARINTDYLVELVDLRKRVEGLDQIAEDALWHDGHSNPEALEDIRKTVKSLGYTQAAILAAAQEEKA